MGLFDSDFEKAEQQEEKGNYIKAAEYYWKGHKKDRQSNGYYNIMRLALLHPYDIAKFFSTTKDEIIDDALKYLFTQGDSGLALVARYYINEDKKLSYTDRYNKVLECLNKMSSTKSSYYNSVTSILAPLEELAKKQMEERKEHLKKRTDYEIKMGIEHIDKKGGFYDHCDTHPNERLIDLKKGTNYYGMFVDNYYDNAYRCECITNVDGWEVQIKFNFDDPVIKGDVCYRKLKVLIKKVPLIGSGRSQIRSSYDISSSEEYEITQTFLNSRGKQLAEEYFLKQVQKIFGTKYASGYRLSVNISEARLDDSVYFYYSY